MMSLTLINCNILDYNIAQKERLDESNSIAKYLFEKMLRFSLFSLVKKVSNNLLVLKSKNGIWL